VPDADTTRRTGGRRDGRVAPARTGVDRSIADLAARLRVEIGRLTRQTRQHSRFELTPSQISALSSLDQRGPLRLGELARVECIAPPTLTKIVTNLEAVGFVARSTDPDDRRSAVVEITREGRAELGRIRTERNAFLAERIARLPPADRARLADAIDLITRLAEPEDDA
jgi:DNA-binding MarR family transcriptional regulator